MSEDKRHWRFANVDGDWFTIEAGMMQIENGALCFYESALCVSRVTKVIADGHWVTVELLPEAPP